MVVNFCDGLRESWNVVGRNEVFVVGGDNCERWSDN